MPYPSLLAPRDYLSKAAILPDREDFYTENRSEVFAIMRKRDQPGGHERNWPSRTVEKLAG
jgi:hypothetical protein